MSTFGKESKRRRKKQTFMECLKTFWSLFCDQRWRLWCIETLKRKYFETLTKGVDCTACLRAVPTALLRTRRVYTALNDGGKSKALPFVSLTYLLLRLLSPPISMFFVTRWSKSCSMTFFSSRPRLAMFWNASHHQHRPGLQLKINAKEGG